VTIYLVPKGRTPSITDDNLADWAATCGDDVWPDKHQDGET
jgi:hypothetical protein